MTPTPPQEQTEREAFEAALASITGRASDLHEFARLMWQGSRASMQAQAPEVAALQREVEELRGDLARRVMDLTAERQALRRLIADDAYAITFQTFGQYRSALLRAIDNATGQ